jgi:hypothetical protein
MTYLSEPGSSALILGIRSDEVVQACHLDHCFHFSFHFYHPLALIDKKIEN